MISNTDDSKYAVLMYHRHVSPHLLQNDAACQLATVEDKLFAEMGQHRVTDVGREGSKVRKRVFLVRRQHSQV